MGVTLEFENIIQTSTPLLKRLRAFANEQDIGLVIVTQTSLSNMVQNIDFGGGQTFDSPFEIRKLGLFSKAETDRLIDLALNKTGYEFDQDDRQFVWDISQGHPFKIQFACSRIFENKVFS